MNITHPELNNLYKNILTPEIQLGITKFIDSKVINNESYNTEAIWIMDQILGGIGGYSMPPDPIYKPFPGGEKRELFRPLQYARSVMKYCNTNVNARHIIHMSGLHLEAVCRLFLEKHQAFGSIRNSGNTFGNAVYKIKELNVLDDSTIGALIAYIAVFNRAKHEVNNDDSKDRLFTASDAIVSYFSARVLGLKMLRQLNYPDSFEQLEIDTGLHN